jgi:hypothetical protein
MKLLRVLVAAAFAAGALGCRKEKAEAGDAVVAAAEPPVPAPEGILGEGIVAAPNGTWGRVQRGVGGALGIMPSTLGGLVCALSGIDPTLGPEIDGVAPAYFTLAGDPANPAFALAVRLVDPRRARLLLADGENARYTARELAGMTLLAPKGGGSGAAIALTPGGFLVLGRETGDLEKLAPYTYRTLPTRPVPESAVAIDVPGAVVGGALRAALAGQWGSFKAEKLDQDAHMRAQHGGRAPDFGDPRALMESLDAAVQRRLALLGDVKSARITLDVGDDDLRAAVALTPASADGPAAKALAAMRPGDVAPLLTAPGDSPMALVWRDDAAARESDAADIEAALVQVLGPRLPADDAKKVHTALGDWAKGRGDWLSFAVAWGASGRGLIARGAASSPDVLARGVREALELTRLPPFHEPLRSLLQVRDVTFHALEGSDGKGSVATFAVDPREKPAKGGAAAPPGKPEKIGVAWTTTPASELRLAIAEDAPALLASSARPGRTLADDRAFAGVMDPLRDGVTLAIAAQPLRLDPARASMPTAPLVLAWGRKGGALWGYADVSDLIVREVLRARMGL